MALLQKAYLGSTALFRNTSWFEDDDFTVVNESSAVTVTANSSAHTKGAWTELVASTSGNSSMIYVRVGGIVSTGVNTATLLDIGVGAAGSESAIIQNVAVGGAVATGTAGALYFVVPIQIASGSRVSARIQSLVTGGKTASVLVRLLDTGDYAQAPTSVDVIGTSTADSEGTAVTAANTYAQLTASTSRAYRALAFVPSVGDTTTAVVLTNYTVAKGASGSEVDLQTITTGYSNDESTRTIDFPFIAAAIPSGTRLSVKLSGPSANFSGYASCVIGIP
jgi:hypothetical protein